MKKKRKKPIVIKISIPRKLSIIFFCTFIFLFTGLGILSFATKSYEIGEQTIIRILQPMPLEKRVRLTLHNTMELCDTKWTSNTVDRIANILVLGERIFGIPHIDVLAICMIESNMRIKARGYNRRNRTYDYGLTQQNQKYYKRRFKSAKKILDKEKIWYNFHNRYDISLNLLSAFIYLHDISDTLGSNASLRSIITSYNAGILGMKRGRGKSYYKLFKIKKSKILNYSYN